MGIVFKRIFNGGVQSRPFKAHKRYEVTEINHSSSFEISILRGISDNGILTEVSTSVDNQIGVGTFLTSSGGVTRELNSIPQTIIWNSINSTFFKRRSDIKLYDTASVVSIPQNKFGENIKPGSVYVMDNSRGTLSGSIYLSDQKVTDEYGLLIANEQTSSTFINPSNTLVYLDFEKDTSDKSNYVNRIV
jgi:hypothetical protein